MFIQAFVMGLPVGLVLCILPVLVMTNLNREEQMNKYQIAVEEARKLDELSTELLAEVEELTKIIFEVV